MGANPYLLAGRGLSALAAMLHVAIIFGGPDWYRFFGAGERMARAAERGEIMPTLVTLGIATALLIASAYAFSGAGIGPRLPLLRTGLVAISAVYLLRGSVLFVALAVNWGGVTPFIIWSSLIVLVYGAAYAMGTWQAWASLSR